MKWNPFVYVQSSTRCFKWVSICAESKDIFLFKFTCPASSLLSFRGSRFGSIAKQRAIESVSVNIWNDALATRKDNRSRRRLTTISCWHRYHNGSYSIYTCDWYKNWPAKGPLRHSARLVHLHHLRLLHGDHLFLSRRYPFHFYSFTRLFFFLQASLIQFASVHYFTKVITSASLKSIIYSFIAVRICNVIFIRS